MDTFIYVAANFFGWLVRNSWQASILIVLIFIFQWLLGKHLSPRARHSLWLLVLVKLIIPGSIETKFSLFNWVTPGLPSNLGSAAGIQERVSTAPIMPDDGSFEGAYLSAIRTTALTPASATKQPAAWAAILPAAWLIGAMVLPGFLLASNLRLGLRVRRQRPVTDAAVLNLLEDCKDILGVRTPLSVVETGAVPCPSLFGFVRPRLLLPAGFIARFSLEELRYVFLHELSHIRRGDIPLNWLATLPLILHWFNPFVWLAFHRMRADGEVACDALALRHTAQGENQSYGRTILKLLESFSRPALGPGMVGILEDKNLMKRRINMIAKFKRTRGWPFASVAVFAGLALATLTDAQPATGTARSGAASDGQAPPSIVSTTPAIGAMDVDPGLSEIIVTFDRDMSGGFSWTGGGPDYPTGQPGKKPAWKDKRTCVLPVKLEQGKYYRVGINSTSFQNFRGANGVPARPAAIYFTTKGASEEVKNRAVNPQIVSMIPGNGDRNVDPGLKELRVTFNVPMGAGFSWTGGGDHYPSPPQNQKPYWTDDKKTCVLPVELKPDWDYQLGINSPSHRNFQSAGGVPLEPVRYSFKTR